MDDTYPVTPQNKINRYRDRATYDAEVVHSIVNETPVAHLSFIPDPSNPQPVVLPMIAQIGKYPSDEEAACYVHGYVSARMFRQNDSKGEGFPVCIAATKVLGFALAVTPFNHNYDYRSAVIHGNAMILDPKTDREEVLWAMQLITDGIVPGRWSNSRVPPDNAEMASTRIMKVRISSASAKVRELGVVEDEKSLRDEKSRGIVWTGTIPYIETLGDPIPADTNMVPAVPAYIKDHVREHNARNGSLRRAPSDTRKIVGLLETFEKSKKQVTYYGIDLSRPSLHEALSSLRANYLYVECIGLWGTWDVALEWSKVHIDPARPRLFLSLRSIFGNDHFDAAVSKLRFWARNALTKPHDSMLLGMDSTVDKSVALAAYTQNDGLYERFIRNGYKHSNRVLGEE
ncbi:uncharacterized protein F4822DRAFT_444275 [Hypoxylon trugodes]|uniref:uncharacterized protein n=1 Tax=Hypoxylon trugodes TaxID=326681 RepID=UPI00219D3108|nr:uncharacterized protein F4822DRAFT_444275 [Hypoxylon trugodes]KAI1387676.1 hypothetical protein F4822DRAFT_444275 [Hypoxylon trugodes]